MLDERDLQAIAQLMDTKLSQQKAEIMHEVKSLIEVDVIPKFGALAAGHDLIIQKMAEQEDIEELREDVQGDLDVLKAIVHQHTLEIEKLKKAQ